MITVDHSGDQSAPGQYGPTTDHRHFPGNVKGLPLIHWSGMAVPGMTLAFERVNPNRKDCTEVGSYNCCPAKYSGMTYPVRSKGAVREAKARNDQIRAEIAELPYKTKREASAANAYLAEKYGMTKNQINMIHHHKNNLEKNRAAKSISE